MSAIDKTSTSRLPVMAEPELAAWAGKTIAARPDTPFVRYGAIAFWTVVAGLILARVLLVDVAKLRPETAAAPATDTPVLIQLTSGARN